MRKIAILAAAAAAAAALPNGTALAEGASQPQAPSGGQASPPSWGTVIANSMCASPAQLTFPGFHGNGDCQRGQY